MDEDPFSHLRTIRLPQLAEVLGVSSYTIKRWIQIGRFPRAFKALPNGFDLWKVADVEAWIREKQRQRNTRTPRGFLKPTKDVRQQPRSRVRLTRRLTPEEPCGEHSNTAE